MTSQGKLFRTAVRMDCRMGFLHPFASLFLAFAVVFRSSRAVSLRTACIGCAEIPLLRLSDSEAVSCLRIRAATIRLRGGRNPQPQTTRKRSKRTAVDPEDQIFHEMAERKQKWKEQFRSSEETPDLSSERGFTDQPDIYKKPLQTEADDVRNISHPPFLLHPTPHTPPASSPDAWCEPQKLEQVPSPFSGAELICRNPSD